MGPSDMEVAGSQLPKAFSSPGGSMPLEPDPMEVDVPDPPGRVWTIQHPVYFISEVLHGAKTRYLEVNKLLYAVLIASRKLHPYCQDHKISVATSNIAKWAVELAKFELNFIARHVVKSQVHADFIAKWTPPTSQLGVLSDNAPEPRAPVFTGPHWTLFFDGSLQKQGVGAGALLLTSDGEQFKYMVHLDFKATNNMTEYEDLIFGLGTTLSLGVRQLFVKGDS
jgi:hypothetical protein